MKNIRKPLESGRKYLYSKKLKDNNNYRELVKSIIKVGNLPTYDSIKTFLTKFFGVNLNALTRMHSSPTKTIRFPKKKMDAKIIIWTEE